MRQNRDYTDFTCHMQTIVCFPEILERFPTKAMCSFMYAKKNRKLEATKTGSGVGFYCFIAVKLF